MSNEATKVWRSCFGSLDVNQSRLPLGVQSKDCFSKLGEIRRGCATKAANFLPIFVGVEYTRITQEEDY